MLKRENVVGTKDEQALYEALEFGALFLFHNGGSKENH